MTRGLSFFTSYSYATLAVGGIYECVRVLTRVFSPRVVLLTGFLAVVSPTQINPLLFITEQQIFTSTLKLGETFSWPP